MPTVRAASRKQDVSAQLVFTLSDDIASVSARSSFAAANHNLPYVICVQSRFFLASELLKRLLYLLDFSVSNVRLGGGTLVEM